MGPRMGSKEIKAVAFYYWSLDEAILNTVPTWKYWYSPKPTTHPKGLAHVFALFGSRYILGISEQKWTEMGEFNSDDHYIYYCGQESLRRNGVAIIVNKRVWNAVLGWSLKNDRMISVRFQGKPFNITVIQVYAPTSNAEEAEVQQFNEDLQDLLELTPKKGALFIIGDWNAKVRSQDWRQEEKGTTEDEMVGWHHQLDGHESEQTVEVSEGQRSLACCSPWGHNEADTNERLSWLEPFERVRE